MTNKYINILDRKCKIVYENNHNVISKLKIKVALNMIVKNEQDNICRTFDSVRDFCDIFVILDTGSEDDTIDIIINYCEKNNKPLYLLSYPFENFSITRNIAIEYANNIADYLLFMDSNDELKNYDYKLKLFLQENINNEKMMGFYIKQEWKSNGKIDRFFNIRLIKTKDNWHYKAPVHEYITCPKVELNGTAYHVAKIENGIVIYQDRSLDAHKSTKRFTRDKELLYNEYLKNPHDSRTLFYLAQTCSCLLQYEEAFKYYMLRTKEKGFMEEVFHAYLRAAEIAHTVLKLSPEEVLFLFMKTLETSCSIFNCPRAEPLIDIARLYLNNNNKLMAHIYIKQACESEVPTDCSLFVDGDMYDYTRWHLLGITGYYVNDFNIGCIGCILAYLNKKKEIDLSNLKTYIDTNKYDFDKFIQFLSTQTTQSISNLFIIKKTDRNIQNYFLVNNVQSILDKFKK
jgi:hypothetical protein